MGTFETLFKTEVGLWRINGKDEKGEIPTVKVYCDMCYANYDGEEKLPKASTVCGHIFCLSCLISWKALADGDNRSRFSCPKCAIDLSNIPAIRTWPTVKAFLPNPERFDTHFFIKHLTICCGRLPKSADGNGVRYTISSKMFENVNSGVINRFWTLFTETYDELSFLKTLELHFCDIEIKYATIANEFISRYGRKEILRLIFINCEFICLDKQIKNLDIRSMHHSKWAKRFFECDCKFDNLRFTNCRLDSAFWALMTPNHFPSKTFKLEQFEHEPPKSVITKHDIENIIEKYNSNDSYSHNEKSERVIQIEGDQDETWKYPEDFPEKLQFPTGCKLYIFGDCVQNENVWILRKAHFARFGTLLRRVGADDKNSYNAELIKLGIGFDFNMKYKTKVGGIIKNKLKRFKRSPFSNSVSHIELVEKLIAAIRGNYAVIAYAARVFPNMALTYFARSVDTHVALFDGIFSTVGISFRVLYGLILMDGTEDTIPLFDKNSFMGDVETETIKAISNFYESDISRYPSSVLELKEILVKIRLIFVPVDGKEPLWAVQREIWLLYISEIRELTVRYSGSSMEWKNCEQIMHELSAKKQKLIENEK